MKLFVCWGTFPVPIPGGHACRNADVALREAGWEPEVIRVRGHGVGPVKWITDGRREVERLSGQQAVPVLVTDTGEVVSDSKAIIAWAADNPASASGST